jgi:hypothetical protein
MPLLLALFSVGATPFAPLPGMGVPGPAGGAQQLVAIGGSTGAAPVLLAVWWDTGAGNWAIHGTRIDATTMTLLDGPVDVTLEPTQGGGKAEVAFGGHAFDPNGYFLVAWGDNGQLRTLRVTLDGGVSSPVMISTPSAADLAVVTSDGDTFVVVSTDQLTVNASLLSADGTTLVAQQQLAATSGISSLDVASAAPGSFYAVWTEEQANQPPSDVVGCPLAVKADAGTISPGAPVTLYSVATVLDRSPGVIGLPDGGYQAAWHAGSDTGDTTLTSVAIGGSVGPVRTWADAGSMPPYGVYRVKLQYDPVTPALISGWGLWDTGAMVGRVPPTGVGPAQLTQISAGGLDPAILVRGGSLFVAYTQGDPQDGNALNVVLEKRTLSGALLSGPVMLSRGLTQQLKPAVAWSGDQALVLHEEFHAGTSYDLMAQRLDSAAVMIDGDAGHQNTSFIAGSDAGIYMAVWMDDPNRFPNFLAGRFDTSGAPLGPVFAPEPMYYLYGAGDVAYCDGVFLIAWSGAGTASYRRYAVDGTALDPFPVALNGPPSDQSGYIHLGRVGDMFVAAWASYSTANTISIQAARVTPAGALLDPVSKTVADNCNGVESLSVAGEGDDAMMAWRDHRNGQVELWGARLRNGVPIDDGGVLLLPIPGADPPPLYVGSTERYLTLNEIPGGVLMVYVQNGVKAVHLTHAVPAELPETLVSGIPVDGVSASSTAAETVIAASLSRSPTAPGSSYRVEVSHIFRGVPGSHCANFFECGTGVCTSGLCTEADGGYPLDAGVDAGMGLDGGMGGSDAGSIVTDAGTVGTDGGSTRGHLGVTCGCDAGGAWCGLSALALLLRRRRLRTSPRATARSPAG